MKPGVVRASAGHAHSEGELRLDLRWLQWGRTLQALAQNGLAFCENPYDRERYTKLQQVASEIMSEYSGADFSRVHNFYRYEQGYATPKVDVRAAVFRDNEVLMVREREDGRWSLPGGWADVGDPPSGVAVREVWEESGFRAQAVKLIAVYDRDRRGHPPLPFHVYKVFFLCDLLEGSPSPNAECSEAAFFAEDNLPELSLTRVNEPELARVFAHHRERSLPAEFD